MIARVIAAESRFSGRSCTNERSILTLSIGSSFVHDLPDNRDSAAITRAIIQMGRSLGITVMAEGVETVAQRDFLAAQGCDELQGLLIGPPLPRAEFEAWVLAQREPVA